jgi:hypothetical protein
MNDDEAEARRKAREVAKAKKHLEYRRLEREAGARAAQNAPPLTQEQKDVIASAFRGVGNQWVTDKLRRRDVEDQVRRAIAEEPPPSPEETAYIEKLLAEAPPLTTEQRDAIAAILRAAAGN